MHLICEIAFQYRTDVFSRGGNAYGNIQFAPERVQSKLRDWLIQTGSICSPVFCPAFHNIKPEVVQGIKLPFDALVFG